MVILRTRTMRTADSRRQHGLQLLMVFVFNPAMDRRIALWLWQRGWRDLARCFWPPIKDARFFLFPFSRPDMYVDTHHRHWSDLADEAGPVLLAAQRARGWIKYVVRR